MKYRFTGKLESEQQMEICNMLARFHPIADVQKKISLWGVKVSDQAIQCYKTTPKWKQVILKLRTDYLSEILEVPIAHKRIRLERLDSLYKAAVNKGFLNVAKDVLRAAQEEIEHKPGNVSIIMNKIEMVSDDELREKLRSIKAQLLNVEDKSFEKDLQNSEVAEVVV